ncbi:quinolinate synthase NadA [bacterium]|nr:quinolinate synthase NadA [bacterium]
MFHWNLEKIRELEALPEAEAAERIRALRRSYGKEVCLLAHFYQRKAITELADFVGDSFGLSQSAAHFQGGKYIVFAGVRFMAESAAILCRPEQVVLHPDPEAGCPMADMASQEEVQRAWSVIAGGKPPIPVTYMNSTADIKAFCGEHGGTICTSSNAAKTFEWAFAQSDRIFFLPDEHLGRNTALKYGIDSEDIAVWDPQKPDGGEPERYADAKVILWRGYCPVHQKFTARDVDHVRTFYPKAKIVVHPECPTDVVQKADAVGSTDFIRKYVAASQPGDQIFIGTEINMIQTLQAQYPDRMVSKLHRSLCLTMYQITMGRLLYTLENLESFPRVEVPESVRHYSRVALDRMLSLQA